MANRSFADTVIPPAALTPCGRLTATPEQFYLSGREEARRVVEELGARPTSAILDIGCGAGRLAIGLAAEGVEFSSYLGIDVAKNRIDWCKQNIQEKNPKFQFELIDMSNARYNPTGNDREPSIHSNQKFDVVYLYSVFSHMLEDDVRAYLGFIARHLEVGGRCFATVFVDPHAPDVTENPKGFGPLKWKGPLHCVLYNKNYWNSLLSQYNFHILSTEDSINIDGQTGFIFTNASK